MKDKLVKFMYGRNGVDELAKFECGLLFVPLILSFFARVPIINLLLEIVSIGLFIHIYFRIFSKNKIKRFDENQKFVVWKFNFLVKFDKKKNRLQQMKDYRFYKCPSCKQQVRVPKGHGKICVTCPRCKSEFIRRS